MINVRCSKEWVCIRYADSPSIVQSHVSRAPALRFRPIDFSPIPNPSPTRPDTFRDERSFHTEAGARQTVGCPSKDLAGPPAMAEAADASPPPPTVGRGDRKRGRASPVLPPPPPGPPPPGPHKKRREEGGGGFDRRRLGPVGGGGHEQDDRR